MSLADATDLTQQLATALDAAWRSRTPIAPLSEANPGLTPDDAYGIQSRWTALRLARGDQIVGRKIGLTNPAIQQQLGVDEPDYGALWRSSFHEARGGRAEIPAADFLQPRLEGRSEERRVGKECRSRWSPYH